MEGIINLIRDPWIPVRLKDGTRKLIRPAEIGASDNPPVRLDAPRPDFNGALAQFLIGLLQTTYAPINDEKWVKLLEFPPPAKDLDDAFNKYSRAFCLNGNGPRFMQDFETFETTLPPQKLEKATKPISWLLIDAPAENTLKNNADHFVKRDRIRGLCLPCSAAALFTLQVNAPGGGQGHRTSIRGGGPLTTLVILDPLGSNLSESLWRQCWLNVLSRKVRLTGNSVLNGEKDIFPWLAHTRIGGKAGNKTTPLDAHPLQMYWAMPRRIRLDFEKTIKGHCSLCSHHGILLTQYITLKNGIEYDGAWCHPLTPYQRSPGHLLPLRPKPGGLSYRYWLGLVYSIPGNNNKITPAVVVSEFLKKRLQKEQLRLWAFGFDMDKMKARCWYETTMPLYQIPDSLRVDFCVRVNQLIQASENVARKLKDCIKKAWIKRPSEVKVKVDEAEEVFFHNTENNFYSLLPELIKAIKEKKDREILEGWKTTLTQKALDLFDSWAASGDLAFSDPARIARARNDLIKMLYGKKLKSTLSLVQNNSG